MPISIRFEPVWIARVGDLQYFFSSFALLRESILESWSESMPIVARQPTTSSVCVTDAHTGRVLLEAEEIKLRLEPVRFDG